MRHAGTRPGPWDSVAPGPPGPVGEPPGTRRARAPVRTAKLLMAHPRIIGSRWRLRRSSCSSFCAISVWSRRSPSGSMPAHRVRPSPVSSYLTDRFSRGRAPSVIS